MQTSRDQQIAQWVGKIGAANANQIAQRLGMGRSWCYQRLHTLVRDGLLEEHRLLHQQSGLYTATPDGLKWVGLGRIGTLRVSLGSFEHTTQIGPIAAELHHTLPA
jgi:DNA-binding PadR family transcriptional regulator